MYNLSYFIIILFLLNLTLHPELNYPSAVPYPPTERLTEEQVFDASSGMPRMDVLKAHFVAEGK